MPSHARPSRSCASPNRPPSAPPVGGDRDVVAGWPDVAALASTTAAAVLAFTPAVGEHFVNGSSYGAERRFPLRPPGVVLLGTRRGRRGSWSSRASLAGPLLLAAGQWVLGGVLVVVGWPLALMGTRSLHRLAQRWLVFVPAGMALVDPLTLADSISMPRGITASIGPAPADTEAYDLSGGALGLALEVRFEEPRVVVPLAGGPDGVARGHGRCRRLHADPARSGATRGDGTPPDDQLTGQISEPHGRHRRRRRRRRTPRSARSRRVARARATAPRHHRRRDRGRPRAWPAVRAALHLDRTAHRHHPTRPDR